jgi:hypothetical protein
MGCVLLHPPSKGMIPMTTSTHDTEGVTTTDHKTIRQWVEARHGRPAAVKSTHENKDAGILRIEFPDYPGARDENLEELSWDEFFRKFDDSKLAFLHQDKTKDGKISRFFKFVRHGS